MTQTKTNRRTFMKLTAGTVTGGALATRYGPGAMVQRSEAIAPFVAGAIVGGTAASLAVGAAVQFLGQDVPSDSLGPDAFRDMIYDAARARESNNASTIVDNQNLLTASNGGDTWFMEAKAEAIQAIQDKLSQSEVEAQAIQKLDNTVSTIEENFLKSWNEGAQELYSWRTAANDAGINITNNFRTPTGNSDDNWHILDSGTKQVTLSDGTNMDVNTVAMEVNTIDGMKGNEWHATTENIAHSGSGGWCKSSVEVNYGDRENFTYLDHADWYSVWNQIQNTRDDIKNSLVMWIDNAYSEVQNNDDFDAEDLRTPLDLRNDMAGENSEAVASLMALGIPVDSETSATIEIQNQISERLSGMLAVDGYEGSVQPGDTIDPNATDANGDPIYDNWYIAYDITSWEADVMDRVDTDYGVQDGKIRITKDPSVLDNEPAENIVYVLETTGGDTAEVKPDGFTDEGSYWQADLSDSLSTLVTSVEALTVYIDVDETQYQTMTLDTTFEIVETGSGEGLNFDRPRELQDDNNYTTPEEWERSEEQTTENIEKWKDANDNPLSLGLPSFGGLPGTDTLLKAAAVVGAVGVGAYGASSLLSSDKSSLRNRNQ